MCIPDRDGDCIPDPQVTITALHHIYIYYVRTMYIYTVQDNCIDVYNPDQSDMDRDGVGGACDNCLQAPNPEQLNSDDDIAGNVCDPDDDNDGRGMFSSCIIGALLTTHTTIF